MTKIVISSGKGGVGKSMLASSLALLFAQKKKIVAVDCDVDAPNLHLWLGQDEDWDEIEKVSTSERPVIDNKKCQNCKHCVDVCAFGALSFSHRLLVVNPFLCEGCGACEEICPRGAIKMKPVKNGEVRIKKNVFGFPLFSAQLYPGEAGSGKIVDELKKRAESSFPERLMILDAPAGTGCPVISALKGATLAVLVTEPTPSGMADLKRVLSVVSYFKVPYLIVINKWDINPKISRVIEREFAGRIAGKIGYDRRVFLAIARLKPIMATRLKAKEEIERIFEKVRKRVFKGG